MGHDGRVGADGAAGPAVGRAAGWTVVVPAKRLDAAKSRLRGAVPAARHPELALAMLRDTVAAVTAVAAAVVVTDDPRAAAAVTALGARVVPDTPGAGLNAALRHGADAVVGLGAPRAVLAGDLPALRPAELAAALAEAAAAGGRAYVPDAAGTGTVLLAAPAGTALRPRFGPGSAAAHAAGGARALTAAGPGLRHDVDTPGDLCAAVALGVGPHTRAVLGDAGGAAGCGASGVPAGRAR